MFFLCTGLDLGKITEPGTTDTGTEAGGAVTDGTDMADLLKSHDPDFLDVPGMYLILIFDKKEKKRNT